MSDEELFKAWLFITCEGCVNCKHFTMIKSGPYQFEDCTLDYPCSMENRYSGFELDRERMIKEITRCGW